VENVRIYEVKPSASENYSALLRKQINAFYWNDAQFEANKPGDYVFFVNREGKEALFTMMMEKGIQARLITGKSHFTHHGKRFSANGDFESFIHFEILQIAEIANNWNWTTYLGNSERYDLWRVDKKLENVPRRLEKIVDLSNIFKNGIANQVLQQCAELLNDGAIPSNIPAKNETARRVRANLNTNSKVPFNQFVGLADQEVTGQGISSNATEFIARHKGIYNNLEVVISFGIGRATAIPWIAYLGYQQRVQQGIYPLFLYYKEQKILILSYGVSEKNKPKKTWTEDSLTSIGEFFNSNNLGKPGKYGNSYVFKTYSTSRELDVQQLQKDLDKIISIYHNKFGFAVEEKNKEEIEEDDLTRNYRPMSIDTITLEHDHRQLLMAVKTKPFILLAGVSGIGKSRLARTLAYKTCANIGLQNGQNPGNFLLVQVKPNWQDSTELLGYESSITGHPEYKLFPFTKFLAKAWSFPNIPFILCLDEMNLAPVEQYFAEYLSAIESRKYEGDEFITDALIPADIFRKFKDFSAFWKEMGIENDRHLQQKFLKDGLSIPRNFIVIGTVNMDETTHSFSRKVLDRAMTIEMSEVDLQKGLEGDDFNWNYPDEYYSLKLVCGERFSKSEVYSKFPEAKELIDRLKDINDKLEGSPFKIAYRVRDEALAYCYYHYSLLNTNDAWFNKVLDEIVDMKVLCRIEGDETKCKGPLQKLITFFKEQDMKKCLRKAEEMVDRLRFGYTSYFS
jgi:5-methylcytosine-specific restriction enzyme B